VSHFAARPFLLRRSDDVIGEQGITSTAETVHGLMRLDGEHLVIQWRVARETDHVGREIRTDREFEPVQEVVVPLTGLAAASVRTSWWPLRRGARLVLTAADLRTFEELAGTGALRLKHPAELIVRIRRSDRAAAQEFAGELELALAEQELRAADVPAAVSSAAHVRKQIPLAKTDPS
jgi:hypothetical protein